MVKENELVLYTLIGSASADGKLGLFIQEL